MMTATARGLPTSEGSDDNIAGPATFLFTDIEGSTEKWEQEPERMAKAVAAGGDLSLDYFVGA
jgi:class 3 adenylate cyclase